LFFWLWLYPLFLSWNLHCSKGANAVFVDSRPRLLPRDISGDILRGLVTRAGGEAIEVNGLQAERIDAGRVATLVATIAAIALYLGWLAVMLWRSSPALHQP
jgi:hypothetical protein